MYCTFNSFTKINDYILIIPFIEYIYKNKFNSTCSLQCNVTEYIVYRTCSVHELYNVMSQSISYIVHAHYNVMSQSISYIVHAYYNVMSEYIVYYTCSLQCNVIEYIVYRTCSLQCNVTDYIIYIYCTVMLT